MSHFIEVTVLYTTQGDPRDPANQRSQRRLINLDTVRLITPTADGTQTILHMREGAPAYFVALEGYAYFAAILTADQPRPL